MMPAKYDRPVPALLLTDFYKICHRAFYHPDTTQLISYWTPRKSRVQHIDSVVMFGLQAFLKKYLIDRFQVSFFERPWQEVQDEYVEYIGATFDLGIAQEEIQAFRKIYDAGYLPIQIRAVPEGTRVPIGCPMIEFRGTEDWAFWLPQYLETIASCTLWPLMTNATIADANRRLLDAWYDKTVDEDVPRRSGAGDFSMRGMFGEDAAMMADAAHLLSFSSTATVPSLWWLRCFYQAPPDCAKGTPSTEHSIAESFGQERELEYLERTATKIRPSGTLSMVSDTWDLWKVITHYLPQLKEQFLERKGKVVIRPDSGNPADILCGIEIERADTTLGEMESYFRTQAARMQTGNESTAVFHVRVEDHIVHAVCTYVPDYPVQHTWKPECSMVDIQSRSMTPAEKGALELLWELVGGHVNTKGYKVLNDHFGLIYGDAITHDMEDEIFRRSAQKGFAANNIILGFGSYTYQYVTRDTFGFALKVTHGVVGGEEVPMFKDPVTDRGPQSAGKKSQKGMCILERDGEGNLFYTDQHSMADADTPDNLLRPVFRNGMLLVDEDFDTIRHRLHPNF